MVTGCRSDEALSIGWPSIDLDAGVVEVFRSKTGTLSNAPIPASLIDNLRSHRAAPKPSERMEKPVRMVRAVLDEACNHDEALVERRGRVTIHTCRHTCITRLAQSGMSLRKIGMLVGHADLETTGGYAHLESSDVIEEARRRLDAARSAVRGAS